MKKITILSISAIFLLLLASCGSGKKEKVATLNDKKVELEKLKSEATKNSETIQKLEADLAKLDPDATNNVKTKLVATTPIAKASFNHYIELQGKVTAENTAYVSPTLGPGQVRAIYLKQGDYVKKGQLLLKLDNSIQTQQVASAKQQSGAINAQLALAKTVYERQKNLWDQGIGTEVQLLTSKTNVSTLENQLKQVNEQVKLAQAQLNTSNVYSDVSGVADVVNIRVGEIFSGNGQIIIVNTSILKVEGSIPENYVTSIRKGSEVIVSLPDIGKTIASSVSFIGAAINTASSAFVIEAKLPYDANLKPNQMALLKVRDYSAENAIAIPLNTMQTDEKGKFVMIASTENGKLIARKRAVTIGVLSGDQLQIVGGLNDGDVLITEGYSSLYEGQQIKTSIN